MFRTDLFKDQWTTLLPKIREYWPNLTDQDLQGINGDYELFVKKLGEHKVSREDIIAKLTPLMAVPAEKVPVVGGKSK